MKLADVASLPATLNADQVSELLGIGRNQVYAGARSGEIPSLRVGGRLLFPTMKLLELLGLAGVDETERPALRLIWGGDG